MTPTDFNNLYFSSLPSNVEALTKIADIGERWSAAAALAADGASIDEPIVVWGTAPYDNMKARIAMGYTWTAPMGRKPPALAPGNYFPGLEPYDPNNAPVGSLPVIDPDWPQARIRMALGLPAAPAPAPLPPSFAAYVDVASGNGGRYFLPTADGFTAIHNGSVKVGEIITENGASYRLTTFKSMFMMGYQWLQVS